MTPGNEEIPATLWTMVGDAGQGRQEAVSRFLEAYRQPMITHLTIRRRMAPADAEDLVHDFIIDKIVTSSILSSASRARGRFRNFMLTSLDNFARDSVRAAHAAKRAPDRAASLDDHPLHAAVAGGPREDHAVDMAWARALIARTIDLMARNADTPDKQLQLAIFRARVLDPILEGAEAIPYDQLIAKFPLASPLHASNALVTAKRTFQRLLREIIAEYAADEAEVDSEIQDLFAIVSQT